MDTSAAAASRFCHRSSLDYRSEACTKWRVHCYYGMLIHRCDCYPRTLSCSLLCLFCSLLGLSNPPISYQIIAYFNLLCCGIALPSSLLGANPFLYHPARQGPNHCLLSCILSLLSSLFPLRSRSFPQLSRQPKAARLRDPPFSVPSRHYPCTDNLRKFTATRVC